MNLKDAADQTRALAKGYKAVLALVEAIDQIGSIEQSEREAKARKEAAEKAADKAKFEKDSIELAVSEAKGRLADAQAKVSAVHAQTLRDAQAVIDKANEKAGKLLSEAAALKTQAEQVLNDAKARGAEVDAQIASRKKDLQAVEKQIASLKSIASGVMGA